MSDGLPVGVKELRLRSQKSRSLRAKSYERETLHNDGGFEDEDGGRGGL